MGKPTCPGPQIKRKNGRIELRFLKAFGWELRVSAGREPKDFTIEAEVGDICEASNSLILRVSYPTGLRPQLRRLYSRDEMGDALLEMLNASIPAGLAEFVVTQNPLPSGINSDIEEFLWNTRRCGAGDASPFIVHLK